MIVVGSGYGASIAASRCARAGQKVCILERGKEWLPGSFPESVGDAGKNFQINYHGRPDIIGEYQFQYYLLATSENPPNRSLVLTNHMNFHR